MVGKFGTREWAQVNKNIQVGCEHGCRYCYACYNAVTRYHRILSAEEWKNPVLHQKNFDEKPRLYKDGMRIMFPTQHDITPKNVDKCIEYLTRWLEKGNKFLIVSKPHEDVTLKLCDALRRYKGQIVFRFTIGSPNDDVLKFWEPNAPDYNERLKSLMIASDAGFVTSVSCEPMLDEDIALLVHELLPFISDSIWLGKMNNIKPRVDMDGWGEKENYYLRKVEAVNKDEFIRDLYLEFNDNPKVHWKDSIKKVLGLPEEEIG
jgi:DNA repair photolyase